MQAPKIPNNEACRLKTLQSLKILDTLPEERFDRVTRMAKRLFNVSIALVSIVDENRQWFKSSAGLDASETPRDISFCGHTILGNETFYIEDASKDPRFADNPLVTEAPNIRFYAGYPIKAADGEKMGTLCIIDDKPKNLAEEDFQTLEDLAAIIEQELAAIQLATLDELTDISNRRGFVQLAQYVLNMSSRQNIPVCLAYFDLDNFKPINDSYGHTEGDRALKLFSTQMKSTFRNSDIFARIGGDEFVVLLTNANIVSTKKVLERFTQELAASTANEQLPYKIGFTYGLAEFNPDEHDSIEKLLQQADHSMYKNKKSAD